MENTKKKNTKYRIKFKFAGSGDYVWRKPFEYDKFKDEFEKISKAIELDTKMFKEEHENGYITGNEKAKNSGLEHYNTNIGKYHSNTDFKKFNNVFYDISRYNDLKDVGTTLNNVLEKLGTDKTIGFVVENYGLIMVEYYIRSKKHWVYFYKFGGNGIDKKYYNNTTNMKKFIMKTVGENSKVLYLWDKGRTGKDYGFKDFKFEILDLEKMEDMYGKMISKDTPIWVKTRIKYKDGQKIEQTEFTITGPMCRGGIADFGEHSIANNVNRSVPIMEGIINEYIEKASQNKEDKLKKVEMVIKGHSRGGVAANIVTNKIIDKFRNNSNIVSDLKLETVAFDPVDGKDNDLLSLFDSEYQNITIEGLDQNESQNLKHGTVVYAMHSSHNFKASISNPEPGFDPQIVKNARVVIISDAHWDAQFTNEAKVNKFLHCKKLGHGVGLDDFEYFSINGEIKKVRKHCYYYNCEGVENHSNIVKRWNAKDETELAINTRKGANLGIYSPGRLYELPDGFYWSKNFVLEKLDSNNKEDVEKFEKIFNDAKFSEKRGEMIREFFYFGNKVPYKEQTDYRTKSEDVLKCLEQCTKWNINTVCPYIESKFTTFGFTEEEIKYIIDVIKGEIKLVPEFEEFLNKMLDKKRFTSSKGVNIGNIIQKLSDLRKKFSEYDNYSGNKIKKFQDAFYIEFGKFIETSKCKGSEQNKIKEGGININKYVEKIEKFLPELFKLFKVKGLLAFGDIIASEIRELIDEFDEKKPEQSYHRLMKLKEKLNDFDPKEDKNIDIDKIKEYWKNLKECISDYMVEPIAYGIQDLIKKKLDDDEKFKKSYTNDNIQKKKNKLNDYQNFKKSYENGNKQKIDEQIKRDKKSKEDARRDEIREKIDKQIEADKEAAKNNGIINKLRNFFRKWKK